MGDLDVDDEDKEGISAQMRSEKKRAN